VPDCPRIRDEDGSTSYIAKLLRKHYKPEAATAENIYQTNGFPAHPYYHLTTYIRKQIQQLKQ
jgi:hypothetical protein